MAGVGKKHKGILKRMKITATGKIVRRRAGKRHLLSHKSGKRLRKLGNPKTVPTHMARMIKRQLVKS